MQYKEADIGFLITFVCFYANSMRKFNTQVKF
ncbi:hypothetical protein Premu_0231 [Hallella multisaccharivorax DSM 17128]|uniref:Uncharacterized protein n=1 Tax=Hallella multisaccharivorax DSM 17128 TaxID=688246 RepID=F8N9K3_9BACT|nr:hypothetical protein Premu_0231 [Hallella multisaccharivorax DSM 17128]